MASDHFQKLKDLVSRALDLPIEQRESFIRGECSDADILTEALALIAQDSTASPFTQAVEHQLVDAAAQLVEATAGPERLPELPNYVIKETLGSGGMGVVYRAVQSGALEREVALKLIRPGWDSARVLARFESERRALSRMEHSNIAQVFEAGTTDDGLPWFAMELVTGEPIHHWCQKRELALDQKLDLFLGVCRGVQHAHQKGIIHRDLKPSNVLVCTQDDNAVAKIIDFGIAKALGDPLTASTLLTMEGQLVGTPEYMSPEALSGDSDDLDIRTDVYSLGVLLFQLLSGELPFDRTALRRSGPHTEALTAEPPRPSTRVTESFTKQGDTLSHRPHELKGDLDWITLRALAPLPQHRYATVQGLLEDIERYRSGQPVLAGPPTVRYRLGKFVRRHRAPLAAALVLLMVLSGGLIESNRQRLKATAALAEAEAVTEFLTEMLASSRAEELGQDVTVRAVVDQAAAALETELAGRDLVQARLLTTMGRTYQALSKFEDAEELLNRAIAIRLELLGPRSPATLTSQHSLAIVYTSQARLDEAITLLLEVLAVRRDVLSDRHNSTLSTLESLSHALNQRGDYEEAVAYVQEAHDGFLATKGPHDDDTMSTVEALGNLYSMQGDFDRAEPLLEAAVEASLAKFGEDHPWTSAALSNLAFLRYDQGRLEECEVLFSRVLIIREKLLGPGHIDVLSAANNLASLRSGMGELESAALLLAETWPRAQTALGADHRVTLSCRNNLAWIYLELGRYGEAEPIFDQVLAARQQLRGNDHMYTLITANNLGLLYTRTGRLQEAEAMHRKVLSLRRESLGEEHPHVMLSMTNLACSLREQGRLQEAEEILNESYQRQVNKLGADHPSSLATADEMAVLLEKWQKPERAAEWQELGTSP